LGGTPITDKCAESSFKFRNLRKLNVSICRYLTDDGFVRMAMMNPQLEILEAR
jgi:hypothetical protein